MTAVKWLDEQLQDTMYFVYGYTDGVRKVTIPLEDYMRLKQVALELEKEQIIDAYANAVMKENNSDYIGMHEQSSAEIYFAETYGSKGSDETSSKTTSDKWKEYQDWLNEVPEISDEEIEKGAKEWYNKEGAYSASAIALKTWGYAIKWYREQLKLKTLNNGKRI